MSASSLPPIVDVIDVAPLPDYRVRLLFEDGKRGIYDVSPLVGIGVFRQLEDPRVFDAVHVEYGTVAWPGGVDIAPEELYENCATL